MTAKKIKKYCLSKLGAVLEYPFGPEPAVFKAGGKMFAVLYEDGDAVKVSLKCESMLAEFLRRQYPGIISAAYHFNKAHWNTLICSEIPDKEVLKQIDHSHDLIMKSLTKKTRERLKRESHPLYLFPDTSYIPLEMRVGDEYYPNGIFIFNITRILEHIAAHRGEYVLGEIRVADYMPFNHIKPEACADADLQYPLILTEISPRKYEIIDGNHRLRKAHDEGVETLQAYMLSAGQHSLFITEQKAYDAYIDYWNDKLLYWSGDVL